VNETPPASLLLGSLVACHRAMCGRTCGSTSQLQTLRMRARRSQQTIAMSSLTALLPWKLQKQNGWRVNVRHSSLRVAVRGHQVNLDQNKPPYPGTNCLKADPS
jgi:hypothetical protein